MSRVFDFYSRAIRACAALLAGCVLLFSLGASAQTLPADEVAQPAPAAPEGAPPLPADTAEPAAAAPAPTDGFEGGASDPLVSEEICTAANAALLITAGIVVAVGIALFFLLHWLFCWKGWMRPTTAFFVLLILISAAAAVVLYLLGHPAQESFLRCTQDAMLREVIWFSSFSEWLRAVVLGSLPIFVFSFIGQLLRVLVGRLRSR